jgi:hypothetical protein
MKNTIIAEYYNHECEKITDEVKLNPITSALSIVTQDKQAFVVLESVAYPAGKLQRTFLLAELIQDAQDSRKGRVNVRYSTATEVVQKAQNSQSATWTLAPAQTRAFCQSLAEENTKSYIWDTTLEYDLEGAVAILHEIPPAVEWARSQVGKLQLKEKYLKPCIPYLPLSMGEVLVKWMKIKKILLEKPEYLPEDPEFISRCVRLSEALRIATREFLTNAFQNFGLIERIEAIPDEWMQEWSMVFSTHTHTAVCNSHDLIGYLFAKVYTQLNTPIVEEIKNKIEQQYICYEFRDADLPLIETALSQVAKLSKKQEPHDVLGFLIEQSHIVNRNLFNPVDIATLNSTFQQFLLTVSPNSGDEIYDVSFLLELKPVLSFTTMDFYPFIFHNKSVSDMITEKFANGEYDSAVDLWIRVLSYYKQYESVLSAIVSVMPEGVLKIKMQQTWQKLEIHHRNGCRFVDMLPQISKILEQPSSTVRSDNSRKSHTISFFLDCKKSSDGEIVDGVSNTSSLRVSAS